MYLRLEKKISPKNVAVALFPDVVEGDLEYDIENVYEWLYLKIPPFDHSLDITRDHGMSDVDDNDIDGMSNEEIDLLDKAGPTYIFAWDRKKDAYIEFIPIEIIQKISNQLSSRVFVLPGRIDVGQKDPNPEKIISPNV